MNLMRRIRKNVFGITQAEMARIAGVAQAQVSRWEHGLREPRLAELRRIRAAAIKRGLAWDDRWFFAAGEREAAA